VPNKECVVDLIISNPKIEFRETSFLWFEKMPIQFQYHVSSINIDDIPFFRIGNSAKRLEKIVNIYHLLSSDSITCITKQTERFPFKCLVGIFTDEFNQKKNDGFKVCIPAEDVSISSAATMKEC